MTLFQCLSEGLFVMLARNLDYAPAADDLPFTVQVIYNDLTQHGLTDNDCDRVTHALNMIGRTCQRWPTTKTIIDSIPPAHQCQEQKRLEKIETEEQRRERRQQQALNLAKVKEIVRALKR